jgi:hypothetical protein
MMMPVGITEKKVMRAFRKVMHASTYTVFLGRVLFPYNTFVLSVKIVASCVLRYLQIAILCDHNIVVTCALPCIGVAAENPE